MNKLRIPVAMAASVIAMTYASASFAQDNTTTTNTTNQAQPAPAQQQPVVNNQAPAQPAPVVVQQQPVGTTQTTAAPYQPAGSDTSEKAVETRPNRTLLSTGIGVFVVSYGATAIAGAISDRDADKNLFIPVVGPWMDLGDRGCESRSCGNREDVNKAMIITSGVLQGAGVLMAVGSLIIPESTTVTEKRTTAKAKPEVRVTPVSFGAGAGVGAVGRF